MDKNKTPDKLRVMLPTDTRHNVAYLASKKIAKLKARIAELEAELKQAEGYAAGWKRIAKIINRQKNEHG